MPRVRTFLALLLAIAAHATTAHAQAATLPGFRDEFMDQFRSSTSKLIALARAMPEEKYAWSPAEGVMPVAQVYAHIARYNYYYPQTGLGIAVPEGVDLENMEKVATKAEVVALLERSVAHVNATIPQVAESQLSQTTELYGRNVPQWSVLFQLLAHMNEHLGQSIAYARGNGVVPPWSR
jgi:uncharacterized damage-inducible protein DinB